MTEPGHYSSARDVALVAAKIIVEHPNFHPIYAMRAVHLQQYQAGQPQPAAGARLHGGRHEDRLHRSCRLLPGRQCGCARCPNGRRRLLSVVLGSASREARAAESQKLLNWGWQAWDAVRLFDDNQAWPRCRCGRATKPQARLARRGALYVTVPKGEGGKLKTTIERTDRCWRR